MDMNWNVFSIRAGLRAPLRRFSRASRRRQRPLATLEPLERRDCPAAFALELPSTPIVEGDRASFTVRMSAASTLPQRVAVNAISGSATLGNDFIFNNATQLLFAPGQTVKTFSVQTFQDSIFEGSETLLITARPLNVPNAAPISAQATIYDLVPTTVTAADVRVTEGNAGTVNATFTVTLGGRPTLPITVQYATQDVSAMAGSDYTATSGVVTFNPGQTSKTITVPILPDMIGEPDETFRLQLSTQARGCTIVRPTVTCTIVNDEIDTPGFQITVNFANPALPASQKSVFEQAVARLQQIIVGDIPGVTLPGGQFIDDMRITAFVETMDPGLNGFAFADAFRPGPGGLPYSGEIHINAARIGNPGIYYTVIHEMLHSLGFYDSFFQQTNTVTGLGTTMPLFTGANAVREYRSYFNLPTATGVPLYGDLAAAGSYGSHWDTLTVGTEIMSVGWDTTSTDVRPFSRMTVAALDDIGYDVNYAAADNYVRPAPPDSRAMPRAVAVPTTGFAMPTARPGRVRLTIDVTSILPPQQVAPNTSAPVASTVRTSSTQTSRPQAVATTIQTPRSPGKVSTLTGVRTTGE